jgi:beta-galactosidase
MQTARVFVDGQEIAVHRGGYLPFEVDLSTFLQASGSCEVLLQLDNRSDPDVPPGKPFDELDFCWFGGLYRTVELRVRPPVHITDATSADEVAGGGVFIRTLSATDTEAGVTIKTHARNTADVEKPVRVHVAFHRNGVLVASGSSEYRVIRPSSGMHFEQLLTIEAPHLWSPDSPALYDVTTTLLSADGVELDAHMERFGIRRIDFSRSSGFTINGRRLRLRGTNRHQDMPRVGYAVPRAAQFRDARRIKEAGFDYVRLSHYPQSPDFLDACDELGIVVMNCIPGWQFIGGEVFRNACFTAARELIRRDRNHPCVVLWELSLNETPMDQPFMSRLHEIGHEEFPGDQMFTCGWLDVYDVFNHSRQHGNIHTWRNGDKALVIAEYGDWEFYASNEGFDQKTGAGVFDRWSTARQFRGDGERGLRQQALNHIMALNDTLNSPAVLDGQWAMFDYPRGYDPIRAPVGVMDLFRLPKFSYYFYRSQRDPEQQRRGYTGGPMVFIASFWTPTSDLRIRVFSNCDEVELRLNTQTVARHRPARAALTQHLPHSLFVFDVEEFSPGTLQAVGYINDKAVTTHAVSTPGDVFNLELCVDDLAIRPRINELDVLIVHARITDAQQTVCTEETADVVFAVEGAELVGPSVVPAEAGIASAIIRLPGASAGFTLHAYLSKTPTIPAASLSWKREGYSSSDRALAARASG